MSNKLTDIEIIQELSKSIIALTSTQRAILELLEMIHKLENRVKELEENINKTI